MFTPHPLLKWSPIALCLLPQWGFACSDDSCYPTWNLRRDVLDTCNNVAFLTPSNDSRVNLAVLLSNQHQQPLHSPVDSDDHYYRDLGYGLVPFPVASELDSATTPETSETTINTLQTLATELHVDAELLSVTTQSNDWSGSRCVSNNHSSALAFLTQLKQSKLSNEDKQKLAETRLQVLQSCESDLLQQSGWRLEGLSSSEAKEFAAYLKGAIAFYNGDFEQARQQFKAIQGSAQAWLQETATYMLARTDLNQAQQNAFDDMGYPSNENVDKAQLAQAKADFDAYLKQYPKGLYASSAIGLQRRVAWLSGNEATLAEAYAAVLKQKETPAGIIQEIDNKLLLSLSDIKHIQDPTLLAAVDLTRMRHREESDSQPAFTEAELQQQADLFASNPALFGYLQAAYSFYVDKDPQKTLSRLESIHPNEDKGLQFSTETLKALALEANQQATDAENIWKALLKNYPAAIYQAQAELGLAMNYERNDKLKNVFAKNSPIHSAEVRQILLRNVADATLLRQQVEHPFTENERDIALFTLLYKNLMHGDYKAFTQDLEKITPTAASQQLYMGSNYGQQTLALFQWNGSDSAEYQCPAIKEVAQTLADKPTDAKSLNCLGDFVLRNGLDDFALNSQPASDELGGTTTQFKGEAFSRLQTYQHILADKNAPHAEKGYALFRAINCFASSGYNGCDSQDIPIATRKQWFQTLKSRYKDTPWAQSLKYYW